MQNKKNQLKPALILCGVVAAVIILIFILADNVNRNVVNNMKGRLLYDSVSADGISAVMMYDFGTEEITEIPAVEKWGNAYGAVFAGDEKVAFIGGNGDNFGVYIYDYMAKNITASLTSDNMEYHRLDYCAKTGKLACLCSNGTDWMIEELIPDGARLSESEIMKTDCVTYDISFDESGDKLYFVQERDGEGVLGSVPSNGAGESKLYTAKDVVFTGVKMRDGTILLCENDGEGYGIAVYNAKKNRTERVKFDSDEYDCTSVAMVSGTQYIVSSDAGGSTGIYACNGSNMVKVDKIVGDKELIVTDYISD